MFREDATDRSHQEAKKVGDDGPPRVVTLLGERLRFETMLSSLSANFINLPATQVDSHIERGPGGGHVQPPRLRAVQFDVYALCGDGC
jgi:hypothetical protein